MCAVYKWIAAVAVKVFLHAVRNHVTTDKHRSFHFDSDHNATSEIVYWDSFMWSGGQMSTRDRV